jgi:NAD(P)-dependent dehydrogenase (short-subunit alcohol dehydrogenase family)
MLLARKKPYKTSRVVAGEIQELQPVLRVPISNVSSLSSSEAVSLKCDVTIWEDQVAMFELAMSRFGSVDVVVSCTLHGFAALTRATGSQRRRIGPRRIPLCDSR